MADKHRHSDDGPEKETKRDAKIDQQVDESFPASDPPSYAGGNHAIGAPPKRETPPIKPKTK